MARQKRPATEQPRPIDPGLSLVPTYRAGLYPELQKFGSSNRDRQLLLWQDEDEPTEITVSSGLDLSVSEDKALSAIQILLDKTGYQGTGPGEEIHSSAFKWSGTLPRLSITYSQYFEAYGLAKAGDGQYKGHQEEEALDALRSLAATRRSVYYERKHWQGRKQLSDIIRARRPLLTLTELTAYKDLEQEEAQQVRAGQEVEAKARARGLIIEPSPLLIDSIDSFFLLKPTTLHKEIQQLLGSRRISRTVSLFIEWLLTMDLATVKIGKAKLIDKLRLSSYIERRHKDEAEARLQESFQAAKELGYLLDYQEDPATGMMSFSLSPDRCSRVKHSRKAKKEEG